MKDLRVPEEVTRYHKKEPTWFISRVPQSGGVRSASSNRAQTNQKSNAPQALPRSMGSGITIISALQHQQAPTSSFRFEAVANPAFTESGHGLAGSSPFYNALSRYSRTAAPHLSRTWGQKPIYSQFATTSSRGHRDAGRRVAVEPPGSLTIVARPMVTEDVDRHGSGHESPFPLRTTSRSTYRLVPVTSVHSPVKPFLSHHGPLTTSIASTAAQFSPMATGRIPEQAISPAATHDLRIEELEASESQLYARGRFAHTPEETEINDNSCISFAY